MHGVFVTWRLADSLPHEKLRAWKEHRDTWLNLHPEPWGDATELEYHRRFGEKIDRWLDAGYGSCLLRDQANAKIVADALHHFNGERYQLCSFVVMPNHVHVLFRPLGEHSLSTLLHSWKRHTSREIHKRIGRTGKLWQSDYWDRLIRSQKHYDWVVNYIEKNPKNLPDGDYILWP